MKKERRKKMKKERRKKWKKKGEKRQKVQKREKHVQNQIRVFIIKTNYDRFTMIHVIRQVVEAQFMLSHHYVQQLHCI